MNSLQVTCFQYFVLRYHTCTNGKKLILVWLDKTIRVSKIITTYSVYHSTLEAFITFEIMVWGHFSPESPTSHPLLCSNQSFNENFWKPRPPPLTGLEMYFGSHFVEWTYYLLLNTPDGSVCITHRCIFVIYWFLFISFI